MLRLRGLHIRPLLPFLRPNTLLVSSSPPPNLISPNPKNPTFTTFASLSVAMATRPQPPVAKKVKHEMELFGDVRSDDYYWLRDDSRTNPEVIDHLKAENEYTDLMMAGVKQVEDDINAEIRGRIKEDDISAPLRKGQYYYYNRTLEGKEYVQHCRRLVPKEGPASVHDVWDLMHLRSMSS